MTASFRMFWLHGVTGGKLTDLDGIDAEDCAEKGKYIKLQPGSGAAVVLDPGIAFYRCLQAETLPPASSTIVHPRRNLIGENPLYWELVGISHSESFVESDTQAFTGAETKQFTHSQEVGIPIVQALYELPTTPYADGWDYLTANEADYVQEDDTKTDFIGDEVVLSTIVGGFDSIWEFEENDSGIVFRLTGGRNNYFRWTSFNGTYVVLFHTDSSFNITPKLFEWNSGTTEWQEKVAAASVSGTSTSSSEETIGAVGGPSDRYLAYGDDYHTGSKPEQGRVFVWETAADVSAITLVATLDPPTPQRYGHFGDIVRFMTVETATGQDVLLLVAEYLECHLHVYSRNASWAWQQTISFGDRDDFTLTMGVTYTEVIDILWYNASVPSNFRNLYEYVDGTGLVIRRSAADTGVYSDRLTHYKTGASDTTYIYSVYSGAGSTYAPVRLKRQPWASAAVTLQTYLNSPNDFSNACVQIIDGKVSQFFGQSNQGYVVTWDLDTVNDTLTEYAKETVPFGSIAGDGGVTVFYYPPADKAFLHRWEGGDVLTSRRFKRPQGWVYIDGSYYVTTSAANRLDVTGATSISACTITATEPVDCSIKFLVSFDAQVTWVKWSGSAWVAHAGGLADISNGNTAAEVDAGLTGLNVSGYSTIDVAAQLSRLVTAADHDGPTLTDISLTIVPTGQRALENKTAKFSVGADTETVMDIVGDGSETGDIQVNFLGRNTQ